MPKWIIGSFWYDAGCFMSSFEQGKLDEYGHMDNLTGLHNLTGVLDHLQGNGEYSASGITMVIYLNIMNFKSFNQRFGFLGGNEFLEGVATEIEKIFDQSLIARTGDQFIILSKKLQEDEIIEKLDQLRNAARKYERNLNMRIKAGIYKVRGDEAYPVLFIDRAKIACDDIIRVYDKDNNFYSDELNKKNELRQYVIDNFESAFKKRYFTVYYQKEVRALTGKVCGYEALARWMDPVHGMISPAIFVEVLESVHLVHKLDIYIIDMVCADLRDDINSGFCVEPVSVNLSRLDFELCDIMAEIDKCREKYGIPKKLLNIEVTESAIASGSTFLGGEIKKFRDAGYQVWMDDFGAGYSSFGNLKSYDFDMLKIDMSFIREFETNKKSRVILATIVNMAKELGIHTLAEGVETQEQYEFLRRIGCEKIQGYFFGKPKPATDIDRSKESTLEVCEDVDYHEYYDDIGGINFLGSTPLRPKTMQVINNLPIGLYEIIDEKPIIIYANDAYRNFLSSLGVSSVNEANKRNQCVDLTETKRLLEISKKAEMSSDKRAEMDLVVNGSVINTKIRFISRHGCKAAFAIVSRNITMHGEAKKSDNIQVAMAHVFNQYFRVDLYDEDGTVENIFLNSDQLAVADIEPNAVKAVQMYSNMYLYEQDRERFRKFYDITTVLERVKKVDRDYLVDYYHSAIPGDNGRMQMYMILPFYYNDRWKYISCCRYADDVSDNRIYN